MIDERFMLAEGRIREIAGGAENSTESPWNTYFSSLAVLLEKMLDEWQRDRGASYEQVRAANKRLYEDILPENYGTCFGNPAFAVSLFGKDRGRLLAFLYAEVHSQIEALFERDKEEFLIRMELFLEVYQAYVCALEDGKEAPDYEELRQIVYWFVSDYTKQETEKRIKKQLDPAEDFFVDIVMKSDLTDLRYLYAYGEYITENEEKLAGYLNSLPEETIEKLADTFTEGYRIGFLTGGKDISLKKTVNIRYEAGFERIIRKAVENFRKMGLEPVIYRASQSIFHKSGTSRVGFSGPDANKQYLYDHKEDQALFLDKKYLSKKLEAMKNAYETYKELAYVHGGPACMESFGEAPPALYTKEESCALSECQQKLTVEYLASAGKLINEYIKGEERSFTIIAFPSPSIGEKFPEIFDAVTEINTLDYDLYKNIQQKMIDTLDKAERVIVKGCNGNRTELTVALRELKEPEKETAFENCLADVNIPVGEVFTSPRLKGTEGVLHVSRVFLNGLDYRDLELHFKDGMITYYNCGNFATEAENKKYMKDNVLFHHDTLPMGEFAIGTNTTAYVAAKKYRMEDKLPVLIAEKTGPHFAVGDTCYSYSEDVKVYNPDGKEIIARDNECSMLRHTDRARAYFNCHTDITIPYDELGEIAAVSKDGERISIIKDGRFVLPGCESLNLPFCY